jgi:predicted ATPase
VALQVPLFDERLSESIFVGRERELAELEAGLEQACSGRGQLILVSGDAGIGKTRLAVELASRAPARGARAYWGRCWEGGGSPSYWPWVRIVRAYLQETPPETLAADTGSASSYLAHIVPELRDLLPAPARLPAPGHLDEEIARFQLFDSMTGLLTRTASRRPLLLVLDDLHVADPPSLLLLGFLARELRGARILVVGTYREVDLEQRPESARLLREVAREGSILSLAGLSEPDVARLIERSFGMRASDRCVSTIHLTTEGNPFLVDEVVRMLLGEGRAHELEVVLPDPLPIPGGIREAIGRRLSPLSDQARTLLSLASAIGREFDLDVLESVSGRTRAQILDSLDEALSPRILLRSAGEVGRFAFSHDLVRGMLYEGLEPNVRAALHRRIAEALEALRGVDSDESSAELACHFHEGLAAGADQRKAVDYAVRAGGRAMKQLAFEEAARHYGRAVDALAGLGADEDRRCALLIAFAEALGRAGEEEHSRRSFRRAAELARQRTLPRQFARAALGLGRVLTWGDIGRRDENVIALLEEALAAIGEEDVMLRAMLQARLADELYWTGEVERRLELSDLALEAARRLGDPPTLAYVLNTRHATNWGPANAAERLALSSAALRAAEMTGQRELALRSRISRIADFLELGDLAAAEREIETYAGMPEAARQPCYRWQLEIWRTMRAGLEGRFSDCERLAAEALAVGRQGQERNALHLFAVQMFVLRSLQGRLGELGPATEEFAAGFPDMPGWRCALAHLYCEVGRAVEARGQFDRLAENDFSGLPRDAVWPTAMALLTQVCSSLGDRDCAAALYRLLLPCAPGVVVLGPGAMTYGATTEYLGILATTLGRWDDAARHFGDALATNVRMGAKPYVARTLFEHARMLLARGRERDRPRAFDLLTRSLDIARGLGMDGLIEKAAPLVARGAPPGSETAAAEAASPCRYTFRQEGTCWTIRCGEQLLRLKDAVGLHYLGYLLRHPGIEFHATELVNAAPPATGAARATQPAADDERRRPERARVAVSKAIARTVRRIRQENPPLGRYLANTIRTGTHCSYAPDSVAQFEVVS